MAGKRITAKQRVARVKNIKIARESKKKNSKKPSAAAQRSIDRLRAGKLTNKRKSSTKIKKGGSELLKYKKWLLGIK